MKKSYRDKVSGFMNWLGLNFILGARIIGQQARTMDQALDKMRMNCFLANPELKVEDTDLI